VWKPDVKEENVSEASNLPRISLLTIDQAQLRNTITGGICSRM
jgi:hypothetical protein